MIAIRADGAQAGIGGALVHPHAGAAGGGEDDIDSLVKQRLGQETALDRIGKGQCRS